MARIPRRETEARWDYVRVDDASVGVMVRDGVG